MVSHPCGLFLSLSVESDLLLSLLSGHFASNDSIVIRLLKSTILLAFQSFVHLLLLLTLSLGLVLHDVALSLSDNLVSSFPGLVDFLNDLFQHNGVSFNCCFHLPFLLPS